jgi:hypothetical protein
LPRRDLERRMKLFVLRASTDDHHEITGGQLGGTLGIGEDVS